MFDCVIATMNSNEIDINEWIVHNILLGFSHIYIYDDHSSPNIKDIVDLLPIQYKECVTIYRLDCYYEINKIDYEATPKDNLLYFDKELYSRHKWNKQRYLMNYFLKTHKNKHNYCMFIDIDEFVYLKDDLTIHAYLEKMKNYDIIYIPWIFYGTSFYIDKPKGLLIDNFRFHSDRYDSCGKSIINMKNVNEIFCIHTICDFNNNYFSYKRDAPLYTHDIHINHYITKSFKSVIRKKKEHCLGQTNDFQRSVSYIIGFGDVGNLDKIRSEHIMKKYIEKINDVLKYELNEDHNTENPEYILNTPKLYLNELQLNNTYINDNLETIIDEILQSNNMCYK
jgi:hypothetical protein